MKRYVWTLLLMGSCTTTPISKKNGGICANGVTAPIVVTYSIASNPPTGFPIDDLHKLQMETWQEIEYLQGEYTNKVLTGIEHPSCIVGNFRYCRRMRRLSVISTGKNSFAVCAFKDCKNLKDSLTGQVIEDRGDSKSMYGGERILYTSHGKDFASQDMHHWPDGRITQDDTALYSLTGDSFVQSHYFAISGQLKESLCSKAGLRANCFKVPEDADEKRKYRKELEGRGFELAAFRLVTKLSGPAWTRSFESALLLDMSLSLDKKVSKKIEGEWQIIRIEWNPQLLCKTARDESELYVK